MPVTVLLPRQPDPSCPRRRWRRLRVVLPLLVVLAAVTAAELPQAAAAHAKTPATKASIRCYRGLGTWVDMYDTKAWNKPAAAAKDMQAHGVLTLYVETANYHWPVDVNRPDALAGLIQQCHLRGIRVVAWYLPGFATPGKDYRRSMAAIEYRTPDGQKFDSFALDIEATIVRNATLRNYRLLKLSKKIRAAVGPRYPLGAIVMSPAGMAKYPGIWPDFPYVKLAAIYDAFVPMGYYTYHGDGYTNAYSDTLKNIRIIRKKTGIPAIPIHVIAGDAAKSSPTETTAYVRALRESGALGGSMYDWATTNAGSWKALRNVRFNPRQRPTLPGILPFADRMGYRCGDRSHPKEAFYQAPRQAGDRVLSFRFYDAQADEIRLLVNWQDVGALPAGAAKKWSDVQQVTIPAAMLKPKSRNVIGFVARGDYPDWSVWGVRDVTLTAP